MGAFAPLKTKTMLGRSSKLRNQEKIQEQQINTFFSS